MRRGARRIEDSLEACADALARCTIYLQLSFSNMNVGLKGRPGGERGSTVSEPTGASKAPLEPPGLATDRRRRGPRAATSGVLTVRNWGAVVTSGLAQPGFHEPALKPVD